MDQPRRQSIEWVCHLIFNPNLWIDGQNMQTDFSNFRFASLVLTKHQQSSLKVHKAMGKIYYESFKQKNNFSKVKNERQQKICLVRK